MKKNIVYIAHPVSGDVQKNLNAIRMIYTVIARECPEIVPFAPYWITCHALDDRNSRDRKIGFRHNKAIFHSGIIDELWVYGDSPGVRTEIEWAKELGIKVVNKDF